ncbi:MAG TPA: M48 family metalloprotease, partial [Candidatus Babeliales bacterium]|nr:M48 family metalloprotease [Candidatus Babeliales bacterium]
ATINYLIALIAQNHSRQDEFAADLIAYQVTNDAASIHSMLTKLAQAYEQHLPGYKAIMRHQHLLRVSSHPTDADRYAALQKLHQQRRYQTQPANKLTLATL